MQSAIAYGFVNAVRKRRQCRMEEMQDAGNAGNAGNAGWRTQVAKFLLCPFEEGSPI